METHHIDPLPEPFETICSAGEWLGDGTVEFVKGIGDTAVELYNFPADVVRYVLGVDRNYGEGRRLTLTDAARRFWSGFDSVEMNPLSKDNLVTGPILRLGDVACGFVYGIIDLVLGHLPNTLFNDKLGLGIRYFSPSPEGARGFGHDLSMVALIAAAPAIKTAGMKALGVEARPSLGQVERLSPRELESLSEKELLADGARQANPDSIRALARLRDPEGSDIGSSILASLDFEVIEDLLRNAEFEGSLESLVALLELRTHHRLVDTEVLRVVTIGEVLLRNKGNPDLVEVIALLAERGNLEAGRALRGLVREGDAPILDRMFERVETSRAGWREILKALLEIEREDLEVTNRLIDLQWDPETAMDSDVRAAVRSGLVDRPIEGLARRAVSDPNAFWNLVGLAELGNRHAFDALCDLIPRLAESIQVGDWVAETLLSSLDLEVVGMISQAARYRGHAGAARALGTLAEINHVDAVRALGSSRRPHGSRPAGPN